MANAGGPYGGKVGDPISFDGSGSSDPDPGDSIVSYHWTFGDGSEADGVQVTHAYNAVGLYGVTLTVTDSRGATGEASAAARVTLDGDTTPPTAVIASPTAYAEITAPTNVVGTADDAHLN